MKRFIAGAALVVALDQATKALAHHQLVARGFVPVIGDLVRLHYVQNAGAVFSLFQGGRTFFVGMTLASIGLIVYLAVARRYRFPGSTIALGLVLGGAIGNLIDRLWLQRVIDFIDIGIGPHRWPTFNVADMGISLGVLYLALGFIRFEARTRPDAGGDAAGGDAPGGAGAASTPAGRVMPDPAETPDRDLTVEEGANGERLDRFLAARIAHVSRTSIQRLIRERRVLLDGRVCRASALVRAGQVISYPASAGLRAPDLEPEALPIEAVFEDSDLLVLHKPAGLVVHPGAGRRTGTLVHRLLHRWPDWRAPGSPERPGIVHRLDRGTSGLMVVARSARAYQSLRAQIASHEAERAYVALVWGAMQTDAGRIDAPIGRDPRDRRRMAVVPHGGRPARSDWQVLARFDWLTLLRVGLRTGRTHQVRVHMTSIGHPIFGDPMYGGIEFAGRLAPSDRPRAHAWLHRVGRVALHAYRLGFRHPADGELLVFEAPVPPDMEAVLLALAERGVSG